MGTVYCSGSKQGAVGTVLGVDRGTVGTVLGVDRGTVGTVHCKNACNLASYREPNLNVSL